MENPDFFINLILLNIGYLKFEKRLGKICLNIGFEEF